MNELGAGWNLLVPLAAGLGMITGVVYAWRVWAWPFVRGVWNGWRQGRRIQRATWALIAAELTTNHGTTLTDKVSETNDLVKEQSAGLAELHTIISDHIKADDRRFTAIFLRFGILPGEAEDAVVAAEEKP